MLYSKHYINGKKQNIWCGLLASGAPLYSRGHLLSSLPIQRRATGQSSRWHWAPRATPGLGGHPRRAGPIGRTERDAPRRNPPKQRHPRLQRRHQARRTPRRRETRLCSRAHFLPLSVRRPREVILTSPQPPSKFPLNFVQQHFRRPKQQVPPPRFISDSLARWDVPF